MAPTHRIPEVRISWLAALVALAACPDSHAQMRNHQLLCEKAYREEFQCESGRYGAFDRAAAEAEERSFCAKVEEDLAFAARKSIAAGSSNAAYWSTASGRQELDTIRKFCSLNGIDKMRNFFCRSYRPRCTSVLARIDRQNAACSGGAKDCLNEARRKQQEALRDLARQQAEHESTVTAASQALSALLQQAAAYANERDLEQPVSAELASDKEAVRKAIRAADQAGGFAAISEAASGTHDPALRGLLVLSAAARGLQEGSQAGLEELSETQQILQGQLKQTAAAEARMHSLPGSTITRNEYPTPFPSSTAGLPFRPGAVLTSMLLNSPRDEAHSAVTSASRQAIAPSPASNPAAAEVGVAGKVTASKPPESGSGPSLRELVARKLRENMGANDANKDPAGSLDPADLISEADSRNGAGAVEASEDSGEGRFRREGRFLASEDELSGVLPAESETLFRRVNRVHREAWEFGEL